ncbi:MAG: efflux RND transporter periplasmic adaptor subunit [Sulfurimonas sp.]|jgi:cobalt-zinc-cadmium efflux system membrane fusion protein|nr:efflux RND transporter periplasmic adaptor subunit [Sulfurimonas sp.]
MKKIFTLLVISMSLFAAQTIEISKKQQDDLGVNIQEVTIIDSIPVGPYNGIVTLDKRDIISIGSTVEAVVENIHVRNLEHVKKGEKLLTLKSNELLNLQEKYIKALIESKTIDKNYERNQKLQSQGIISSKKLLESIQKKQSSDLRVKLSANELLASGFSNNMLVRVQNNHQPIMQFNILATRDGIINKIDVNIGEKVESNRSMMNIYADGKRFIELSVPVHTVGSISIGDKSSFEAYSAKITAIGNVVNSESQSVQVRALIDNAKNIMINRIYPVIITKKISGAVKIKKSALVFDGNNSYVFKRVAKGFEVISVSIIKEGPSCYIVHANLKAGDAVAVSSTSALLGAVEFSDE